MIVNIELLKEVANEKKHTFISTGMSTLEDISKAIEIFKEVNCPFELMHCVSTYPMKDTDANLNTINTLRNIFKFKILISITILVFLIRNFDRINNEINKYDYNPLQYSFYSYEMPLLFCRLHL